jgi:pimeloyl-ACP methyl ester carboxylesterase
MSWLNRLRSGKGAETGLYTEILGTGTETIVFIAGLGGTTRYWASRVRPLEDRYRVVLVDLLGFGQSPKPWKRYDVERQVHELHAALADFGPVSLIGHSLGALITVAYAARHPEQVRNIALIGMPYFGSQRTAYRYMRRGPVRGGFLYTNVVLTMVACILTRRVFGRILPYIVRTVPREVAEDLVKHTWRSSTSSLWEVVYRYDAAPDLGRLPDRMGVLCIHGDRDPLAPLAAIEQLTAKHPRWRLHVFSGFDHHPFLRNSAGCLALIDSLVTPPADKEILANTCAHAGGSDH